MSLRRVIEHSVAATVSETAMETRRGQVRELTPTHIRLAVQSIDAAVFAIPAVKFGMERVVMGRKGFRYIGSGAESRVYSNGQHVMKYVMGSDLLSNTERNALSDKKKAEFDQVQAHLAPFLLDQTITVAPHAAKRGREVVQTVQAHTGFETLVESDAGNGTVQLHDTSDAILDELSDFVDASWDLYGKTGLLPDTNGTDNIVQTKGGLLLIDTQPITIEHAPIQDIVIRQLGSIASLLETIS